MKQKLVFSLLLIMGMSFFSFQDVVSSSPQAQRTDVTLFLSYIPSVQFAPLYVAKEHGYFEDEDINIEFEHSFNEADGVDRIATNNLQFGIISGEQVILARQADKPLVYVMEWYHRFPVGVVVPADSDIDSPEDLQGRAVSLPGFFGASYIGLRALMDSADLDEFDVFLQPVGFAAVEMMCTRQVEAATVYIVNEPLTIEANCYDVRIIEVSDYAQLVSNGLVTNEQTLRDHPDLVRSMIRAIQHGVADTIDDPDTAFELSLRYVPDLPEDEYDTQYQVLLNSVELWRSDTPGMTTLEAWETTQQVLIDSELMNDPLDNLEDAFTNNYLPEEE